MAVTTAGEVLEVLRQIERGEVTLERTDGEEETFDPEYRASNGWRFKVFDDCGGWDYLEAFAPPDEDWTVFPQPIEREHPLYFVFMEYRPPREALAQWGWTRGGLSPSGYSADA